MTSRYILLYYEGADEKTFLAPNRDDCTQPYMRLFQALAKRGIKLEMIPNRPLEDYCYICFWNVYSLEPRLLFPKLKRRLRHFIQFRRLETVYAEALRKGLQERMVLFLTEPPTVCPDNYRLEFHRHFKTVFTWNCSLMDCKKYVKFNLPTAELPFPKSAFSFHKRKFLVDISGNKHSTHERELYSERRRTIQYFEKHFPNHFDLYGLGWSKPKPYDRHRYRSYRGTIDSKQKIFSKYRFAICFENIRDEPNYISNRIFDVLQSDCVPVYWGAPNIADYIDPSTMVNRADFSSNYELSEYLSAVSEDEFKGYRNAIKRYVFGHKIKAFFADSFIENFISTLGL